MLKINNWWFNPINRFIISFIGSVIGLIFFIFALSIFIDPWGLYGTNIFKPLTLTPRGTKLALIAKQQPRPDIIIFGSSRMFEFNPDLAEKYTKLKTFNASVGYARPEEYYTMSRYIIEDLSITPKFFLIGFNIGEFNYDSIEPETINSPALRKYLSISRRQLISNTISTFKRTVNLQYLIDIVRTLLNARGQALKPTHTFLNNGSISIDENAVIPPKTDFEPHNAIALFKNMPNISPERKKYFEEFLAYSQTRHIQVIGFITPMPTSVLRTLKEKTNYSPIYDQFSQYLDETTTKYPFRWYDFSSVDKFNGHENGFNDSTHPSKINLDLIMEKIFSTWPKLPPSTIR